jgi:hypothetical protein
LDNFWRSPGSLAVGAGERLHDWRIHSYSARHRSRRGIDQNHSGPKTCVNDTGVHFERQEESNKEDYF